MREAVDAVMYLSRTACQWRYIPANLLDWHTARHYFDRFRGDET